MAVLTRQFHSPPPRSFAGALFPKKPLIGRMFPSKKLLVWVMFNLAFAMIPFAFAVTGAELGDPHSNVAELIERGDMYLVVVALLGHSLGKFVMTRKKTMMDIVAVSFCTGIAIMTAFEFGIITQIIHAGRKDALNTPAIWLHTSWYLCAAAILGIAAIIRREA